MHCARVLIMCCLLASVAASIVAAQDEIAAPATAPASPTTAPTTRPMPSGPPVPDEEIRRLGQALAAAESSAVPQAKLRQLRMVYRDGAQLEQQHATAPNLYAVRTIMLNAARSLAALEADPASTERLIELAKRIAESSAPPEARFWPQVLLTQAALRKLPLDSPEGAELINDFVTQFAQSPVEVAAIMLAVDLAETAGHAALTNELLGKLSNDHRYNPEVEAFLQNRGRNIFQSQSVALTFARPDGTPLRLPIDTLGNVVLLHFWTAESLAAEDLATLRALHDTYAPNGLEIVSINLDREPEKFQQFLKDNPMPWTHAVNPRGLDDPAIRKLKLPMLPFGWLIGRDGRALYAGDGRSRQGRGVWLSDISKLIPLQVATRHARMRLAEYRSGTFLPPQPVPAASRIPTADLQTLRQAIETRPLAAAAGPQRVAIMRAALQLGRSLETNHPTDPALPWVRYATLITARWLAVAQTDADADRASLALAERLQTDAAAPPAAKMLADYVLSSKKLAATDAAAANDPVVRDFLNRYATGDLAEPSRWLGFMLAIENARNAIRNELVRSFRDRFNAEFSPALRGMLRDLCGIEVDNGKVLRTELTAADGSPIKLPESLDGNVVVLHFWSMSAPPEPYIEPAPRKALIPFDNMASAPARKVVVLCINLDPDRAAAEAFATEKLPGCLHVFSGQGWDDPLAKKLSVQSLPHTFILDRYGRITQQTPSLVPRMTTPNHKPPPPATQPVEVQ